MLMTETERILVVVDPIADLEPAFERALWLAGKLGAALDLLVCDYDQHLAAEHIFDAEALKSARKHLLEAHMKKLRRLAQQAADKGVATSVDARWDHPLHEGIVRKAEDSGAAIVVKDTHFHPILKRSMFSNTDWNLIRECPVPLLLVKPRTIRPEPLFLAAVDPLHERDKPADLDRDILALTRRLTTAVGGELAVFHAFDPTPAFAVSADSVAFPLSSPIDDVLDALRQKHLDAVRTLAEANEVPSSAVHMLEGGTRETLVALTEKLHADFVVMGAVSRSALQRLFLGSTAEQMLDVLPCDLLIVKPRASRTRP
jgi:universal stress protein E